MATKSSSLNKGKQYDEVVVIVLLMALKSSGGTASSWYQDMAALDGTRTVSSLEHSLRAANKLAGELLDRKRKGEAFEPALIGRPSVTSELAAVAKKRKRVVTGASHNANKGQWSKANNAVHSAEKGYSQIQIKSEDDEYI
ncbi:uncharacterized protein PV09_04968 [Verruconis gallopava]|uniref:Uncharacterized protein n=1 Tax=Verruconis gallopava TaxID=253628 RepID=A0A0D1XNL2_9PEZI|nr:uncharacterized protein PV09_04968 [Verruconis gallopava]KIW04161.1 hypothetical protein PV09_04968 [Verruconis gallopava]